MESYTWTHQKLTFTCSVQTLGAIFGIYQLQWPIMYLSLSPTLQDFDTRYFSYWLFKVGGEGWIMLVIRSLGVMWTMQAFAKSPGTKSGDLAGHSLNQTRRSSIRFVIDSLVTQLNLGAIQPWIYHWLDTPSGINVRWSTRRQGNKDG